MGEHGEEVGAPATEEGDDIMSQSRHIRKRAKGELEVKRLKPQPELRLPRVMLEAWGAELLHHPRGGRQPQDGRTRGNGHRAQAMCRRDAAEREAAMQ